MCVCVCSYESPSTGVLLLTGPLPKTVVDFWRLVWQEKPPTIVMITNLKEGNKIKCQHYWPESGTESFGPFQITITDDQTLADYTIRTLLVQVCRRLCVCCVCVCMCVCACVCVCVCACVLCVLRVYV